MAIKFSLGLVARKADFTDGLWIRYEPLSSEEADEVNDQLKIVADLEEEEATKASNEYTRDLVQRVKELWNHGTVYKDPQDIEDTIMASPIAAEWVVETVMGGAYTKDTDAPFSARRSTGR